MDEDSMDSVGDSGEEGQYSDASAEDYSSGYQDSGFTYQDEGDASHAGAGASSEDGSWYSGATDSLASGLGDVAHGAWDAMKGVGYAAADTWLGTAEAIDWGYQRVAAAGDALIGDADGVNQHLDDASYYAAGVRHADVNIAKDLGLRDGEREPWFN